MFGLSKIKLWLVAAGGALAAALLLAAKVFSAGRTAERVERLEDEAEQTDEYLAAQAKAANAGNRMQRDAALGRLRDDDGYRRQD